MPAGVPVVVLVDVLEPQPTWNTTSVKKQPSRQSSAHVAVATSFLRFRRPAAPILKPGKAPHKKACQREETGRSGHARRGVDHQLAALRSAAEIGKRRAVGECGSAAGGRARSGQASQCSGIFPVGVTVTV